MDVVRATSELEGSRFSRFAWVDETVSTNADLVAAARSGAAEQVLGAEFQTAGRGRLGRVWEAPRGASLLCSFLVRIGTDGPDPHLITAALGLAAAEAIAGTCGLEVGIKWPNDLVAARARPDATDATGVADDRKLAGILAEAVVDDGSVAAVVAGIGINVNWPDELPGELAGIAVSLNRLLGRDLDRTALVVALVRCFAGQLDTLAGVGGAAALRDRIVERSATLGRTVRVELPAGEVIGSAVGIGLDGHLLVESAGTVHEISVGDVVHLRPIDFG